MKFCNLISKKKSWCLINKVKKKLNQIFFKIKWIILNFEKCATSQIFHIKVNIYSINFDLQVISIALEYERECFLSTTLSCVLSTGDIETSERKNPKNIKGHLVQKLISFHHNKKCPYCPTSSHSVIILRVLSKDSSVVLLALSCSDSNSLSWGPASAPAPAAPAAAILLLDYVTGAGKSQDAKHLKHTTELIKFWHSFCILSSRTVSCCCCYWH